VSAGNEVNCYYQDTLRDQIANLLVGSLVEVTGLWSETGRGPQIDRVTEIDTVDTEPIRLRRLRCEGATYELSNPLTIEVEYTDGLWVYHSLDLNTWGIAERRDEAFASFCSDFDYMYEEIACEDDANLDRRALAIKQAMTHLVNTRTGAHNA